MNKRIAILSTSATVGGAAIVTSHLVDALRQRGHTVELFVLEGRRERRFSFLAERLGIFIRNGLQRSKLFDVSMADFGTPGIVEKVRAFAPDAIILGWINQGFLSLKQIEELGKTAPLTWVMHDMWNFTGICHYSFGCMRFCGECGDCPMLAPFMRSARDLSHNGWQRKRKLYESTPIRFVAVSSWVKDKARRSTLLENLPVEVIHNVYPIEQFTIGEKEPGLIVMGAERIDDPRKGLNHAIEALNLLAANSELKNIHMAFFGRINDPTMLNRLKVSYQLTGSLKETEVAQLLSRAQVVLSTSLYETLGNTLVEGQASGAVPVAFDRGGQVDVIDHKQSGYLAPFGDIEAIARGVEWALSNPIDSADLRAAAKAKFGADAVAARFEELIF